MSIGDAPDFARRLYAAIPRRWFPDLAVAPILGAVLAGLSSAWASVYAQMSYAALQTRIATATGGNLEFIAGDYFGLTFPRQVNESDAQYSARIRRELLRERGTRAAVVSVLTDLTGRAPVVFEPARATDTGGYGFVGMTAGTGLGYGVAGGYGSLMLPFQAFVTAYRPTGGGVAGVGGYYLGSGWAGGGYGVGAIEYVSTEMIQGAVTDAAIFDAAARVMPVATIAWMRILP